MPKLKTQLCGRCRKRLAYPKWVHSRHTNSYYCTDIDACARRARKKR